MSRTTSTIATAAALAAIPGVLLATTPADAAAPAHTGRVVSSTLMLRSAPTSHSAALVNYPRGQRVQLVCKVHGQSVGGNDIWYKTSPYTGAYVSARYVANVGAAPRWCTGNRPTVTATTRVVVRDAPVSGAPAVRSITRGTRFTVVCETPDQGRNVLGWYYTTDGNWVHGRGVVSRGPIVPCR